MAPPDSVEFPLLRLRGGGPKAKKDKGKGKGDKGKKGKGKGKGKDDGKGAPGDGEKVWLDQNQGVEILQVAVTMRSCLQLSEDQLKETIVHLRAELEHEREERNYFQLERDKINTFWEITKKVRITNASYQL